MSRRVGDSALNQMLDHCLAHPDAFQAGCAFPDWGYDCLGFGDASEAAHWPPFIEAASLYLHGRYVSGSPAERLSHHDDKFSAFLLGVMSHSVSDIAWHNLGPVASDIGQGMIQQLAVDNFAGDYDAAHSTADDGAEFINAYEQGLPWLQDLWWLPVRDLTAIYHQLGYASVADKPLAECNALLFAGAHLVKLFGDSLFEAHAADIAAAPFLLDSLKDYWIGGLDDMATWTAHCWQPVADWIVTGTANLTADCPIEPQSTAAAAAVHRRRRRTAVLRHFADVLLKYAPAALRSDVDAASGALSLTIDTAAIDRRAVIAALLDDNTGNSSAAVLYGCAMRPTSNTSSAPLPLTFATAAPYAYLGSAIASGDWNGDGVADVAIAAPGHSSNVSGPSAGRVYVFYGPLPSGVLTAEHSADVLLDGSETGERFGSALVSLDFNADGVDDLCVGASSAGALQLLYYGRVVCYWGSAGTDSALVKRSSIVGQCSAGASCPYAFANFGSVLVAADANADGYADLLVGMPAATIAGVGSQAGGVLGFVSSPANGQLDERSMDSAQLQIRGTVANAQLGSSLAVVAGGAVLLAGAPYWTDDSSQPQRGCVVGYALHGNGTSAQALFSVQAAQPYSSFGSALAAGALLLANQSSAVDVVAVAAVSASTQRQHGGVQAWQAGEVYLLNATALLAVRGAVTAPGQAPLLSVLMGASNTAAFGQSLSIADVDGDGDNDLLVGQFRRSTAQSPRHHSAQRDAGALFAYFGGRFNATKPLVEDAPAVSGWCAGFPYQRAWFGEHTAIYRQTPRAAPLLLVSARVNSLYAERAGTVEVIDLSNTLN